MSLELPNPLPDDPELSSKESAISGSLTTSMTIGTQEDKEYMSSLSQKSSPRLPSILLPPSRHGETKLRSSEGRVPSLNLPKHPPLRHTPSHPSSAGQSRKHVLSHTNAVGNGREVDNSGKGDGQLDDGIFNFGIEEGYTLGPEDPEVLADVQKALKAKVLREASKSGPSTPSSSIYPAKSGPLDVRLPTSQIPSSSLTYLTTPPRATAPESPRTTTPFSAVPQRVTFPLQTHSPSRSLESISFEGPIRRPLVPILVSLPDGSSYLDWSGAPLETLPSKDRTLLGRTLSITRRKGKEKLRPRGSSGRHSVDLGASQGDLHVAQLDNIRRAAKRETWSRLETTREELGRRYNLLFPRESSGEHPPTILDVVKSRPVTDHVPWFSWIGRRVTGRQKPCIWTITSSSAEEFLRRSTPVGPSITLNIPDSRSHSPSHGFSSPFLSSRSSVSISPVNRSFSSNPIIEGIMSPSPSKLTSPVRSLSMTQSQISMNIPSPTTQPRRSIDAMLGSNSAMVTFTTQNRSPRNSLDPDSLPQSISSTRTEKDSLRKRVQLSLSGDRSISTEESRTSKVSSLTNLFSTAQPSGGRLHLGMSNMFGIGRRSGEEGSGRAWRSRSSMSDERESGWDGEGTKSDEPGGPGRTAQPRMASVVDFHASRSRGKHTPHTSDSDPGGHLDVKSRFQHSEKDRSRGRSAENTADEVPESASVRERRLADSMAGPTRRVKHTYTSAVHENEQEKLQEQLRIREEAEERLRELYKARETMLIKANDHNRRIARLLKAVGTSVREHESAQSELAQVIGAQYAGIPREVLEAIAADPATTLRHGNGWRAVEHSHHRFNVQQALLVSHLATLEATAEREYSLDLANLIKEADELWRGVRAKTNEIEQKCSVVQPALETAITRMEQLQREYNDTQILVETDYPEQSQIADLETIITEYRSPRGWLEFAAFWIPELVLEVIGGFIRFFGVPISEKFIRPFLWYFFRNRYYWKLYSTEPPPSSRAWYTRLGYWVIILSILAWYTTG